MKCFVTGATGFIGSAVVQNLVKAKHKVTGLVRSAEKAAVLKKLGATPLRGDIRDMDALARAAGYDVIIHAAFEYSPQGAAVDRIAVEALLAAAKTSGKIFIYTSGVLVLGNTPSPVDETASTAKAIPMVQWRPATEKLVLEAATRSLATAVIRPGFVFGAKGGLPAGYFKSAAKDGAVRLVGDGKNRLPFVHRDDLADLYRRVAEKAARGIFHGVDGAAPTLGELARGASELAGRKGAVHHVPVEEARQDMGPFVEALTTDQVVVTHRAAEVGWKPTHKPLPAGLGETFAEWRAK